MLLALPLIVAPCIVPQEARSPGQERVDAAIDAAALWLAAHQDEDGRWDADGFGKHDPDGADAPSEAERGGDEPLWKDEWLDAPPRIRARADEVVLSGDRGAPYFDVAVTGLSLLALMEDGNTSETGPYAENVAKGLEWLRSTQDEESGLLGTQVGTAFLYGHAIGTLALVRALEFDADADARAAAQAATNFIARARNPYGVWRYDVPPIGDNDTSVTTWMTLALRAADDANLKVDRDSYHSIEEWLDAMTDPETGRVGYTERGSVSSRVPGLNDSFPLEGTETLTAAGLMLRLTLGQKPVERPVMIDHVKLILRALPAERADSVEDALWVFFGTRALRPLGGKPWSAWSEAQVPTLIGSQATEGPSAGSWAPESAWSFATGRVGTTAILAWSLAEASQ